MKKKKKGEKDKSLMIIVATTSLPAVTARTPTAGTPHARAKMKEYFMSYVLLRKRRWNKKKKNQGQRKMHTKISQQAKWNMIWINYSCAKPQSIEHFLGPKKFRVQKFNGQKELGEEKSWPNYFGWSNKSTFQIWW